jgi:hypothetical protein
VLSPVFSQLGYGTKTAPKRCTALALLSLVYLYCA